MVTNRGAFGTATRIWVAVTLFLLLANGADRAYAVDVFGRVVDVVEAKAHGGATVRMRSAGPGEAVALADVSGFFRFRTLAAGSYLIDVALADGRAFKTRLVVLTQLKTQYVELDYSKALPTDDEDY
jgi:hypothetical protein